MTLRKARLFLSLLLLPALPVFGERLGIGVDLVETNPSEKTFPLVSPDHVSSIHLDAGEHQGVTRAAGDLQADVERVSGKLPDLRRGIPSAAKAVVLIGTLGKSPLIDGLAKSGKINARSIAGKWESFLIATVSNPLPGVEQALVIAGSDKRGTIYGIYELSEQIGVSPWHWWADVPVKRKSAIFIKEGTHVQGPPAVKYRGIFLNDEEPALGPWARDKFGGVNSKMYAHVFELILRLRGNYLWPAMWGKAFNEDDPINPKLADEYGIVMGTSHHEPMMRAQQEWTKRKNSIGNGQWNYATNRDGLHQFWKEGIERNKDYENLVTLGMRGDGDEPMVKSGDMAANIKLLEGIVADQRKLIAESVNRDVTKVPQVWALYKEVSDYYDHGMKVPDDVTLLWCDDNWGNLRRLPTPAERKRSGGAGIYYHFDYVGSPRSYRWLNTNPLPKIWEQMTQAYENGADRIWIVNVGDLKPMELPIEFWMRMAWSPRDMKKDDIADFTRRWAEREFGSEHAAEIADLISKYAKYNAWRKPELLEPATFSLVNHQEAERVLDAWRNLTARAEALNDQLAPEFRDAFYQLVLYPIKGSATVAELHIATGMNRLYASQKRASTNDQATRVRELFRLDQELSDAYHKIAGGKWNHMMAQSRIGYTTWDDPDQNIMPALKELQPSAAAELGVAVEGSEAAWPGSEKVAELPVFDSIRPQRHYIEVFRRGNTAFAFTAKADQPWVKLSSNGGEIGNDARIWVDIDWQNIPTGSQTANVTIARDGGESVSVAIRAIRNDTWRNTRAFGGLTGPTAIAAEDASANIPAGKVRWERIPDYGRGVSGVSVFPVTSPSAQPPQNSPRLEYPVLVPNKGEVRVDLLTGPTLNYQPGRGVRIAVSFDDKKPQVLDAFAEQGFPDPNKRPDPSAPAIRDWGKWVRDNSRILKSTHMISKPGMHTLKVWMVDPGVVLESIVVNPDEHRPSYFGPPKSTLQNLK